MKLTKYISKLLNRISLIGKIIHLYRIRQALKVIKKLKEINKTENSYGRIMNYLRKINPYVFEELVLTVIENSNLRVFRNKRYSGDGGIDGIFKIKTGKVLIQCKRYSSYINNADVIDLCNKTVFYKHHLGIFVHTGKTGNKAKETIKLQDNIIIISGSALIDLILGNIHIEQHINKKLSYNKYLLQRTLK